MYGKGPAYDKLLTEEQCRFATTLPCAIKSLSYLYSSDHYLKCKGLSLVQLSFSNFFYFSTERLHSKENLTAILVAIKLFELKVKSTALKVHIYSVSSPHRQEEQVRDCLVYPENKSHSPQKKDHSYFIC